MRFRSLELETLQQLSHTGVPIHGVQMSCRHEAHETVERCSLIAVWIQQTEKQLVRLWSIEIETVVLNLNRSEMKRFCNLVNSCKSISWWRMFSCEQCEDISFFASEIGNILSPSTNTSLPSEFCTANDWGDVLFSYSSVLQSPHYVPISSIIFVSVFLNTV